MQEQYTLCLGYSTAGQWKIPTLSIRQRPKWTPGELALAADLAWLMSIIIKSTAVTGPRLIYQTM